MDTLEIENTKLEKEFDEIKKTTQLHLYENKIKNMLEKTIKNLLKTKEIKLNSSILNRFKIKEKLKELDTDIVDYALFKFKKAQQVYTIRNKAKYFQAILLNAVDEYVYENILLT